MSGSFTLTGKLMHHDKVTPHVNARITIMAVAYPDGVDNVVYSQGADVLTDPDGTFTIPTLLTETDLYYTAISQSTPPLFDTFTFAAPAAGSTVDLADLTTVAPGAVTPSVLTAALNAAAAANASAAAAALSAASISRETSGGVAGLDGSGKLFETRLPDRLRNVAAREYSTLAEAGYVAITHPAYGADPTGVAAADTAIAAAATAAAALGLSLMFPPGSFKVSAGLAHSHAGQTWLLAPGAVLDGTASTSHVINMSASNTRVLGAGKINAGTIIYSGVFISAGITDPKVLGPEINGGTYGVRCKGGTGAVTTGIRVGECTIHDQVSHSVFLNWEATDAYIVLNKMYSMGGNGVWAGNNSDRCHVMGNKISSCGRIGIELNNGCPDSDVSDNTINVCASIGISLDRSDRTRKHHNTVLSAGSYGLELAGSNHCTVDHNIVKDCASQGISISALTGTCDDNLIEGNDFIRPGQSGINAGGSANGAKRLKILGNTITDAGAGAGAIPAITNASGIGCDSFTIVGNTIRWTATATVTSTSAINVAHPNATVIGNEIIFDAGITTAGGTGINLASTALSALVSDNKIIGNGKCNKGIQLNSAVTGCHVAGNQIYGTQQNLIDATGVDSTNTITGNSGTISAGSTFTMGSAVGSNRVTSQAYVLHTGPTRFDGAWAFNAKTPTAPGVAITGSRSSATVAVLAALLTELDAKGIITNSTSA